MQLQNMMTSKYISYFLEEISTWQKKLSVVDQVMPRYRLRDPAVSRNLYPAFMTITLLG